MSDCYQFTRCCARQFGISADEEPWPGGYIPPDHGLESGRNRGLVSVVPVLVAVQALGDHRMRRVSGVEINAGKVSMVIETDPLGSDRTGDVCIHGDELAFGPDEPMVAGVRVHIQAGHHALVVDAVSD